MGGQGICWIIQTITFVVLIYHATQKVMYRSTLCKLCEQILEKQTKNIVIINYLKHLVIQIILILHQ